MITYGPGTAVKRVTGAQLTGLLSVVLSIALSGCGGLVQHVSDSYPRMVQALPFEAKHPIAREMRYTVYRRIYLKGDPEPPSFVTTESGPGAGQYTIAPAVVPNSGSVVAMSRVYEQKQARARADGNRLLEAHYRDMSYGALQSEIAAGRLQATLGVMQASLGALGALGRALFEADAKKLADWVAGTTRAVGPSAPAATVLHLGFFWYVHGERFGVESRSELIVTAVLERSGRVRAAESARAVELNTYKRDNPSAARVGQGYVVHDQRLSGAERMRNLSELDTVPLGRQLAVIAHAALADLYAQVEENRR